MISLLINAHFQTCGLLVQSWLSYSHCLRFSLVKGMYNIFWPLGTIILPFLQFSILGIIDNLLYLSAYTLSLLISVKVNFIFYFND